MPMQLLQELFSFAMERKLVDSRRLQGSMIAKTAIPLHLLVEVFVLVFVDILCPSSKLCLLAVDRFDFSLKLLNFLVVIAHCHIIFVPLKLIFFCIETFN